MFRRGRAEDREQTRQHGIAPVDLVVVNLYPFEATAARPDLTVEELIENIDIGGPAMVRSASKNFESVAVVTDPADYPALAKELSESGDLSLATRLELARKAFAATARYDGRIATELERLSITDGKVTLGERPSLPARLHIALAQPRGSALRRKSAPEGGALHSRGPESFRAGRRDASCKARNFPTTTSWTWTPPGDWRRNLRGRRR